MELLFSSVASDVTILRPWDLMLGHYYSSDLLLCFETNPDCDNWTHRSQSTAHKVAQVDQKMPQINQNIGPAKIILAVTL